MTRTDEPRLAAIQRAVTSDLQRYARAADAADEPKVEAAMRDLRVFVAGLFTGLTVMGMTEPAAREVIRLAGWDAKTGSYRIIQRPSIFQKWERKSA
jgi:hypothetical protein